MKGQVTLNNNVGLAGEPVAAVIRMRSHGDDLRTLRVTAFRALVGGFASVAIILRDGEKGSSGSFLGKCRQRMELWLRGVGHGIWRLAGCRYGQGEDQVDAHGGASLGERVVPASEHQEAFEM